MSSSRAIRCLVLGAGAAIVCVGPAGGSMIAGADAKVKAATVAERRGLAALRSSAGAGARYRRVVVCANGAASDLRAAEALLAAYARSAGPLADDAAIQRLLSEALAADSQAGTSMDETLWLIAHGAPPADPPVRQVRAELSRAVAATVALEKFLSRSIPSSAPERS